jgi:hypothetical protein
MEVAACGPTLLLEPLLERDSTFGDRTYVADPSHSLRLRAHAAAVAASPPAAPIACWQGAETFDLFCSRHFSAAEPPVGTPAHTF